MKTSYKFLLNCGWQISQQNALPRFLEKQFMFGSFNDAFSFITSISMLAERHDHHPDWSNSYKSVRIKWNSHECGGDVTDVDWEMAHTTEKIYSKYAMMK